MSLTLPPAHVIHQIPTKIINPVYMGNASQGMMLVGRSSKDIKGSAVGQFVFANRLAHGDDHGGDDEAGVHCNGDDEA